MSTQPELLPCPFCDSPAAMSVLEGDEPGDILSAWVSCACGIEMHERRTEAEAAMGWNARASGITKSAEPEPVRDAQGAGEPRAWEWRTPGRDWGAIEFSIGAFRSAHADSLSSGYMEVRPLCAAQCAPPPSGEPVAWRWKWGASDKWIYTETAAFAPKDPPVLEVLYAHPASAEIIERCAKVADGWLARYGKTEIEYTSAQEYACDAVQDIADGIRSLAVVPDERDATTSAADSE